MKKIIYGISFLALVGAIVVGCQKEDITPVSNFSIENNNTENSVNQRGSDLYHLVENFPELGDIGCYKPAENCFPVFIVRRSSSFRNSPKESLDALKDAMRA